MEDHVHGYGIYQTDKPQGYKIMNLYHDHAVSQDLSVQRYHQTQRLQTIFRNDHFSIFMVVEGRLWHGRNYFQIENSRYAENFMMWCTSLDDYYINQTSISVMIHERYAKLLEFVRRNVEKQSEQLKTLLIGAESIEAEYQKFEQKSAKFESQFHMASTMYTRSASIGREPVIRVIVLLFQLMRKQSEFLLASEDAFFRVRYHSQTLKEILAAL